MARRNVREIDGSGRIVMRLVLVVVLASCGGATGAGKGPAGGGGANGGAGGGSGGAGGGSGGAGGAGPGADAGGSDAGATDAGGAPAETFPVGSKAFDDLADPARGRKVPATVHYPMVPASRGLRFPLVVFSHGAAGTRLNFKDVGMSLASHGYVVAVIEHQGSNASKLQSLMSQGKSFLDAIYAMLDDTTEWEGRPRDVSFVIDTAGSRWNVSDPDLAGRIDLGRVAVGGHSYGAYTTIVVGGTLVDMPSGLKSFKDPRVRAILPMSPDPPGSWAPFVDTSYAPVDVPMFAMSGSMDAGFDFAPEKRLVPFEKMAPPDKFHLVLQNVAHGDFSQVASQGARAKDCQKIEAAIGRTFFDAILYKDAASRSSLKESYTDSLATTQIPDTVLHAK